MPGLDLFLKRDEHHVYGTFGTLTVRNEIFQTIEQPWRGVSDDGVTKYPFGQPSKSCVPVGEYKLVMRRSPRYGLAWHLVGDGVTLENNNRGRFACLFHPANWPYQLQGCVGLGSRRGFVMSRYGVEGSKFALNKFERLLVSHEKHHLVIE